jgi:hypothetical protein
LGIIYMTTPLHKRFCETCLERGRKRFSSRLVAGSPMCEECWSGKPVRPQELWDDWNARWPTKNRRLFAVDGDYNPSLDFVRSCGFAPNPRRLLLGIPCVYPSRPMRLRPIRRFGAPPIVLPEFYRMACDLHDSLLTSIGTRPVDWTERELADIHAADQKIEASENDLQDGPGRLRVLLAVNCGIATSAEIAPATRLPLKTVSAWLSVLCAHGEIVKVGAIRLGNPGRETYIYASKPAG